MYTTHRLWLWIPGFVAGYLFFVGSAGCARPPSYDCGFETIVLTVVDADNGEPPVDEFAFDLTATVSFIEEGVPPMELWCSPTWSDRLRAFSCSQPYPIGICGGCPLPVLPFVWFESQLPDRVIDVTASRIEIRTRVLHEVHPDWEECNYAVSTTGITEETVVDMEFPDGVLELSQPVSVALCEEYDFIER